MALESEATTMPNHTTASGTFKHLGREHCFREHGETGHSGLHHAGEAEAAETTGLSPEQRRKLPFDL